MFKLLIISLLITISNAQKPTSTQIDKLILKGEKMASVLCSKEKLPNYKTSIEATMVNIETSLACSKLSSSKLKAIAYYLQKGISKKSEHIVVPKNAKCPVCGMFVSKYPKWSAKIVIEKKELYFDGVKDMMKYYIFDGDFKYNREKISQIIVSDYYTLEAIDAKEAFFVKGSNIYGPMGHELIAFKDEKSANSFKDDHAGKSIVKFKDITADSITKLD
jgi:nitrous oxide reductase accessory protein NosL